MPLLTAHNVIDRPMLGMYRVVGENDEAMSSQQYSESMRMVLREFYGSVSLRSKATFTDARRRLEATTVLAPGWNTYGAEPPSTLSRALAARVLDALEKALLPPLRVTPSAEGGIALSFAENANRAVIEIYNTGETAAATYSDKGEPESWELEGAGEAPLRDTINRIRVHLAA